MPDFHVIVDDHIGHSEFDEDLDGIANLAIQAALRCDPQIQSVVFDYGEGDIWKVSRNGR